MEGSGATTDDMMFVIQNQTLSKIIADYTRRRITNTNLRCVADSVFSANPGLTSIGHQPQAEWRRQLFDRVFQNHGPRFFEYLVFDKFQFCGRRRPWQQRDSIAQQDRDGRHLDGIHEPKLEQAAK